MSVQQSIRPTPLAVAFIWFCVGLLFVNLFPPPLELCNDCVQYLHGARSIARGEGYTTAILYFDEHFLSGMIPAPQTVWPPGYSALIALLMSLGVGEYRAAIVVSQLAYAATLPLMVLLTMRLGAPMWLASAGAIWWLSSVRSWAFAASINSDILFTSLTLLAFLVLSGQPSAKRFASAILISAFAFCVRYTGIFLFLSISFLALCRALRNATRREMPRALLAVLPGGLMVSAILLRNFYWSGTLQGGNQNSHTTSLPSLGWAAIISGIELLVGVSRTELDSSGLLCVLAAISFTYLTWLFCRMVRNRIASRTQWRSWESNLVNVILLFCIFYLAGVIWISQRTALSFGSRYLMPLMPCFIPAMLIASSDGGKAADRRWTVKFCFGLCALVLLQASTYPRRLTETANRRAPDYSRQAHWIREHVPPHDTIIVLAEGSRVGFLAERKTIAVPEPKYSARVWDIAGLRELAAQYKARWIVAPLSSEVVARFPDLFAPDGGATAAWTRQSVEIEGVRIFMVF